MHNDGTDLVHPDAGRGDVLNGDGVGARVPLYPLLVHARLRGCNVFWGLGIRQGAHKSWFRTYSFYEFSAIIYSEVSNYLCR